MGPADTSRPRNNQTYKRCRQAKSKTNGTPLGNQAPHPPNPEQPSKPKRKKPKGKAELSRKALDVKCPPSHPARRPEVPSACAPGAWASVLFSFDISDSCVGGGGGGGWGDSAFKVLGRHGQSSHQSSQCTAKLIDEERIPFVKL